jgi:hypothetical protein
MKVITPLFVRATTASHIFVAICGATDGTLAPTLKREKPALKTKA